MVQYGSQTQAPFNRTTTGGNGGYFGFPTVAGGDAGTANTGGGGGGAGTGGVNGGSGG